MTVSQLYKAKQQHHGGINIKTEDIVLIKEDIKSQSLTDWRFGNKLEVLKENGGKVQGTKLQILSKSGTSTTCHQSLQKIKTLVVVVTEQKNEFMIMVKRIEKEEN